jgi:hypothetical protein
MTSLEQLLSSILELIQKASLAGDHGVLAELVQRKQVICAALGAHEHSH